METYTVPQFPPLVNTIHIALFHNVTNAPAIRKRLIQAATTEGREGERMRGEVDFAFLEGKMVRGSGLRPIIADRLRTKLGSLM
jgi:EKC/KEOPS complex subunit CGI121/TPRKB